MGLVLSRPSDVAAVDAVPALEGLPGSDDPVFVGGPVAARGVMVLAEFDDVDEAAAPIFGRARVHGRRGRAGRALDPAPAALRRLLRLGRRPARGRARGAVLDRRRRRDRRRVRRRPGRALAHRAAPQGRPVRADGRHAVRPRRSTRRQIGGSPTRSRRRAAGPGTFGKRNGAGSRPGCTNQHSPVASLVAASHIASATSSGCEQREPGRRERARAGRAVDHRRVGDPGADGVDPDRRRAAARRCARSRRRRASSASRSASVGIAVSPASDAVATIAPRVHHLREAAHAEDDAVDVDRDRAPVLARR